MMKLARDARSVPIGIVSTQLMVPQDKRHAVFISAPSTNRVSLGFGAPAILDQGITLYPGNPPLILLYDHIGQAIREEITAIAAVAAQNVSFVDVFHG